MVDSRPWARIPHDAGDIPWLTAEQMAEVDRVMIVDYGIKLIQMMENAGRCLAHLARRRFLAGDAGRKRIVVLVGSGGNGGGALVCARRLHNWGALVSLLLTMPEKTFSPIPAHQLAILRQMKVPMRKVDEMDTATEADLVVDGVLGYGLSGAPRGSAADLIRWGNRQTAPTLALDIPSGVDATTGEAFDPAVRAAATLTLALPKQGLRAAQARRLVGELYLADIGVPPELYSRCDPSLEVAAIFSEREIIRLQ